MLYKLMESFYYIIVQQKQYQQSSEVVSIFVGLFRY